jgi:putative transposase
MARLPRLSLAGHLHYLVQRGNNGQTIATGGADFEKLYQLIDETARSAGVALHAYVLMPHGFELLATPQTAQALPQMMQALGRRYVRHFNDAHGRSGTLWDGRYRSTVMQAERHLLQAMAFLDLKPVHQGLVSEARSYPWSSHAHFVGLRVDRAVTPHTLLWRLGNTPFAREAAYADFVQQGLSASVGEELSRAVCGGWALGDAPFVAELQAQTSRRMSPGKAGRPAR